MDIIDILVSKAATIYKLSVKAGYTDLVEKIADLRDTLVDMKSTNTDIKEKNLELQKEVKKLREALNTPPEFKNGLYYDPGQREPYCTHCWETDRKKIHLAPDGVGVLLQCPHCKAKYNNPYHIPREPRHWNSLKDNGF